MFSSRSRSINTSSTTKPKISDDTINTIKDTLENCTKKYKSLQVFKNTNKITYYINSDCLKSIIVDLKPKKIKKPLLKSIKNTLSSFKRSLTKKKSNTYTINSNINSNNKTYKDFLSLLDNLEDLLKKEYVDEDEAEKTEILVGYVGFLQNYLNNPNYCNQTLFGNKPINLIFIDKIKQEEIEKKARANNSKSRINALERQSMSSDFERLRKIEANGNNEINKKHAMTLVKSLNTYFNSISGKDVTDDNIIKSLYIYTINYEILKLLLEGHLKSGESEEQLHRLYYELLKNIKQYNEDKYKKNKDKYKKNKDTIIDLILNIRLQILKETDKLLPSKELERRFAILKERK
jgi:hypothetical protein